MEAARGYAVGVQADITSIDDLRKMVQTAIDTYGRRDVLINNAGMVVRASCATDAMDIRFVALVGQLPVGDGEDAGVDVGGPRARPRRWTVAWRGR